MRLEGYMTFGFRKKPHDMIRPKKYKKCGCGGHSRGKKQRGANKWQVRDGIRKIRRAMAFKHSWMTA